MEHCLMPVAIKGSGGGSVNLTAGAAASDTTLTLPNTNGTVIFSDSSGNVGIGTSAPEAPLEISKAASGTLSGQVRLSRIRSDPATNSILLDTSTVRHTAGSDWEGVKFRIQHQVDSTPMAFIDFNPSNSGRDLAFGTDNTERMRIDASGNLLFNSGYGSVATAYGCRAWVNFNGTGTVAIRASGNVTSITDNGAGDYTVSFTTAMPDANYSVAGVVQRELSNSGLHLGIKQGTTVTASQVQVVGVTDQATLADASIACVAIFR